MRKIKQLEKDMTPGLPFAEQVAMMEKEKHSNKNLLERLPVAQVL